MVDKKHWLIMFGYRLKKKCQLQFQFGGKTHRPKKKCCLIKSSYKVVWVRKKALLDWKILFNRLSLVIG